MPAQLRNRGRACIAAVAVSTVVALAAGCRRVAGDAGHEAGARGDVKALARQSLAQLDGALRVSGLRQSVDVVRDRWGVPHIYAQNEDDLFFAQGYVMAQDRLWQMEWWRRIHEGRLSEVLGPAMLERDRRARLLKFRGPFDGAEWSSYHQDAKRLFTDYADGINAYIRQHANNLPVEFTLTGIAPTLWTAETVVLREPAMAEAVSELRLAMDVARYGVKEANRRAAPDPWAELTLPVGLDVAAITPEAVAAARAGQEPVPRVPVIEPYRTRAAGRSARWMPEDTIKDLGSNNWVVGGAMSPTGKPIVSNDPHREVSNPSLRYIVHLNAPGWNVIGSGDPPFVGVSMGHNEKLAWGLTITGTDFEDVFVEDLNPANANEIMYNGKPEPLRTVTEEVPVNGEPARRVTLTFSRHGPIFYVDEPRHKAYAVRSIFSEPGTASYLGELKLDQARDCREFIQQAMFWKANSENLICGDVDGNIAFQASALTPNRKGWDGRLPVPGTGRYEWDGFRSELPKEINPARGFIATANNNIHPKGYWPPVVFKTSNGLQYDRITRILQVIKPGATFSMDDSRALQRDVYSLRGAADRAAFQHWTSSDPNVERARDMVATWDAMLTRDSVPAAIYITWRHAADQAAPLAARTAAAPPDRAAVEGGLKQAIATLTGEFGPDWSQWHYGRVHVQAYPHPILTDFDLPTVERRGGNGVVAADGATYREIIDVANWDRSLTINTPGQSGQPESPYYGNLLPIWANDEYFQMAFSRKAVDEAAAHRLTLKP